MKIAFVSPMILPVSNVNGGAVEQLMLDIVRENEKNYNFDIDLYSIYSENIISDYKHTRVIQVNINFFDKIIQKANNFINKILKRKRSYMSSIEKCIKLLNRHKYDKVIIENNMFLYKRVYEKTKFKDKLYYHMHNDFNECDKTHENYMFIETTAQRIFTVSEYIKRRLMEVKKSKKIFVLNNCIDYDLLSENNIKSEKLQEMILKNGLQEDDFVICYVGRVIKEKGILELITAFKRISMKYDNVKLLIVGSSWFADNYKKTDFEKELIKETNEIQNKIIFTGYVKYTDIIYYYKLANVCVIPSICNEAFGVVALEAMYYNIPIIATKAGALPDILEDCALYVNLENLEEDIEDKIEVLINNKNISEELRNKCKLRLNKQSFNKDRYFEEFCNYIKES